MTDCHKESCRNCRHFFHYSSYEFPSDDEMGCDKHPGYANLTSFPFKKKMKCFEADAFGGIV